jgi:SAM-dependent methyltransferase
MIVRDWNDLISERSEEVVYEPSSPEVVSRMLVVAEVGPADTVYDLGCGDGRIVIAAARDRGARGVGIDHDPERITESRENAIREGVADRVRFFEEDLFASDFSEASVVMLYLLPEANLKLRPRILKELKAGSRIVSHSHDMGAWEPDGGWITGKFRIYSWIVPANAGGVWQWTLPDGSGARIRFDQRFQKLFGRFLKPLEGSTLIDAALVGKHVGFKEVRFLNGTRRIMEFAGVVNGDRIEGCCRWIGNACSKIRPWSAFRAA